jgi:hypothetical protein
MFNTTALRNMRKFFTKHYYTDRLAAKGEQAMDTLLGTMLGVLFLAVITSSFAGVYMAYAVSTAKASESTSRTNVAAKLSSQSLNGLFIDSASGKTLAQTAGWTVVTQGTTLLKNVDAATQSSYANYTFAARKPMVDGGKVQVAQWGVLERTGSDKGLVKAYTAIPKAGSKKVCDWTQSVDNLNLNCVVVYDVLASVVMATPNYDVYADVQWESNVVVAPWSTTPNYYTADQRPAQTSKLGNVTVPTSFKTNADGSRTIKYVALLKDLEPNKQVSVDFKTPGQSGTLYGNTFTPAPATGQTGKLERSVYGTMNVPAGITSLEVFIDTDNSLPTVSTDPIVQISRFVVYQPKASS